jgi:hypothetical protein
MVLGNAKLYRSSISNGTSISGDNYEDRSLFVESLDLLREHDRFMNSLLKTAHTNVILSESSKKDEVFIHEFSIIDTIKNIIDFFIDAIKSLWGKFKTLFQKITYSDSTIDKYEDRLKSMKYNFTVTFPRYNYTCFDDDIPSINLKNTFYEDYSTLEGKLQNIADLKTKSERCERFRSLEADVKSIATPLYYDQARQRSLKTTYPISSSDYSTELFNRFRDGGEQVTSKITPDEVTITFDRYKKNKNLIKSLEKAKNDTINAAKDVKKMISSIRLQNINKNYYVPYDTEEEALFDKILQVKSGQVDQVCNIYIMVFSAKLDAAKDAAVQDKKVLFDAIKVINTGGER